MSSVDPYLRILERIADQVRGDPEYAALIKQYEEAMQEPPSERLENMELWDVTRILHLVRGKVANTVWGLVLESFQRETRVLPPKEVCARKRGRMVFSKLPSRRIPASPWSLNGSSRSSEFVPKKDMAFIKNRLGTIFQLTLAHVRDTVAALDDNSVYSLESMYSVHWQGEREVEVPMKTGKKKWTLSGCADYVLSYGSFEETEKICIIVKAREHGFSSGGQKEMLGCMAMVQERRRALGKSPMPIFGIATDSYDFHLYAMNETGVYQPRCATLGQSQDDDLEVMSYLTSMIAMAATQAPPAPSRDDKMEIRR